MIIQWFPGHMAKARRILAKAFPNQDVIIEVLDARMPYASSNPIVTALRKQKPCIKILSKSDLADSAVTKRWVRYLERPTATSGKVIAIASSSDKFGELKSKLPELCQRLAGRQATPVKPIRAIVVGIPNVGKSTLINVLMGRKIAKVGDEPAVTKMVQTVTLANGVVISDNPGLLWPKIMDPRVGLRLAFAGAISEAAIDYELVARYGASLLLKHYTSQIQARYKLTSLPATGDDLLLEIGRRRGCLKNGGIVDLHKAADVIIHDFRGGAIGKISLEIPADSPPIDAGSESESKSERANVEIADDGIDDEGLASVISTLEVDSDTSQEDECDETGA